MSSRFYVSSGISLVELMIAVTLLSLISVAALQFVRTSESTMIGEQVLLDQQQRSEAVSSHIYKKFISRTLAETATEQSYLDPTMAEDLRDGTWVSMPGTTAQCDPNQSDSICGYYREFDSTGLPAGVILGEKLTVNMDRFREFCAGS